MGNPVLFKGKVRGAVLSNTRTRRAPHRKAAGRGVGPNTPLIWTPEHGSGYQAPGGGTHAEGFDHIGTARSKLAMRSVSR